MATKKNPTFEERLARLQEIVETMEKDNPDLNTSIRLYKEGLELSKACREELEKARNEVVQLTGDGSEMPFDENTAPARGFNTEGSFDDDLPF